MTDTHKNQSSDPSLNTDRRIDLNTMDEQLMQDIQPDQDIQPNPDAPAPDNDRNTQQHNSEINQEGTHNT